MKRHCCCLLLLVKWVAGYCSCALNLPRPHLKRKPLLAAVVVAVPASRQLSIPMHCWHHLHLAAVSEVLCSETLPRHLRSLRHHNLQTHRHHSRLQPPPPPLLRLHRAPAPAAAASLPCALSPSSEKKSKSQSVPLKNYFAFPDSSFRTPQVRSHVAVRRRLSLVAALMSIPVTAQATSCSAFVVLELQIHRRILHQARRLQYFLFLVPSSKRSTLEAFL
mmetsp:Transcript_26602/g.44890  ORF Transcript_26602/g.44890 Transcript_26602/m.44890 type:complete len:220 (-) Transcript_26602:534-1193(-)